MKLKISFALIGAVTLVLSAMAAEVDASKLPPPADKKGVTFEADIKPTFEKSCIECHGAVKPKGKLRLDTVEGALKGGVGGKVIEPGNSAKSTLVHNIAFLGDEEYFMPPPDEKKFPKLTPEQIALVRAWIDQGAK